MKFKKIFLPIAASLLALTGCTNNDNSISKDVDSSVENSKNGSKSLVVYFSATGSTERVAGYIANHLFAMTFELEPINPYTSADLNYSNSSSRVTTEHNDPNRHVELVSTTVENFSSYSNVFIGYPIWWGIAAWPVDDFVKNNDFSGKTVIPFATSASSGIGQSASLLKEMNNNTGTWLDGMRFSSSVSKSVVTSWVDGLNL